MKRMIFFYVLIFLFSGVFAATGVDPRSYEVEFKPGLIENFSFDFVLNDVLTDLYIRGDLANYLSLDKEKIYGRETVIALLSLPLEIATPGINQIDIVAGDIVAAIKVKVPYPEKFVELELSAPNVNVGEESNINLKITNVGIKTVSVSYSIEIYKNDEKIEIIKGIQNKPLNVSNVSNYMISLNTSNYSAGNYKIVVLVNYDENIAKVEKFFRLGKLSVRILNYSKVFRENKIDKFEINVESLWNSDIKNLYAELRVLDSNVGFDTQFVRLNSWEKKTLMGFFDTKGISNYDILANITLYYDGESSSEIVKLKILKEFDYIFYVVVLISLIIASFLIWRVFLFIKKLKIISK